MPHRTAAIAVTLMALAAIPASAADHPAYTPQRDVVIDYVASNGGAGAPRTLRIYSAAYGTKLRVESGGMPGYLVMDRADKQIFMVMAAQHMYMEVPTDPTRTDIFMLNDKMAFTRKGTDTVAGLSCTVWDITNNDPRNGIHTATGCITDDGVLLRGVSVDAKGEQHSITATAVSFRPLPPETFLPPADYKKFAMPAGMPAGMAPGGGRPPG